ncbi:MAG: hypothetical protein F8N36_12080 [Desulfovibrio sp.]|uniref:hypothetical protein n=1 Tax=Desulfovibrio sp. TaxID=885 RepID=UPI00135E64DE|nr:hypothetical protein [Desulfovibrio sp.]MTJ93586.1 hypothetical protein [Desulfovibrio sp.]
MFIAYRSPEAFPGLAYPIAEFVDGDHFSAANGYDDASRDAIMALELGDTWSDPKRSVGHAVTKIPSQFPPVGARVKLRADADWWPDFQVPAGAGGTVVQADEAIISVKLDEHVDGAEGWENCIQWYPTNHPGSLALFWQLVLVEENSSVTLDDVVN